MHSTKRLYLASSNSGKLREFSAIATEVNSPIELALLPGFPELAEFPEDAPTFAENAVGKALHAATITENTVCADDSGLVVPALGGQPGVHSARYAGPNATGARTHWSVRVTSLAHWPERKVLSAKRILFARLPSRKWGESSL